MLKHFTMINRLYRLSTLLLTCTLFILYTSSYYTVKATHYALTKDKRILQCKPNQLASIILNNPEKKNGSSPLTLLQIGYDHNGHLFFGQKIKTAKKPCQRR